MILYDTSYLDNFYLEFHEIKKINSKKGKISILSELLD